MHQGRRVVGARLAKGIEYLASCFPLSFVRTGFVFFRFAARES
jgi:hypothetical protein